MEKTKILFGCILTLMAVGASASEGESMPIEAAAAPLLLGVAVGLLIYNIVVGMFVRDVVDLWHSLLMFSSAMLYGWWVIHHSLEIGAFQDSTSVAVFTAIFLIVNQRFLQCYIDSNDPIVDRAVNVVYALSLIMMVMIAAAPAAYVLPIVLLACLVVMLIDFTAVLVLEVMSPSANQMNSMFYLAAVFVFASTNLIAYSIDPDFLILASLLGWLTFIVVLAAGMAFKLKLGNIAERSYSQKYHLIRGQLDDLARQNTRLQKESSTDGLTKIGNRAHFDMSYRVEWDRAYREQLSVALLLVDIDHFKRVNDRYGHIVGDECLIAVALAIRGCLHRASDRVMRYGGEEFVIILGGTDAEGVTLVGSRIMNAVKSIEFTQGFRITISIGGASSVPSGDMNSHDFLRQVDEALYRAKEQGRDRLVMAEIGPTVESAMGEENTL